MELVPMNLDLGLLILRLALGLLFFAHGPDKILKSKEMAKGMGMQESTVMIVGTVEIIGAISLIFGIWSQIGALLLAVIMIGGIYYKVTQWHKKFTGEMGWELDFITLAAAVTILIAGPGAFALI